MKLLMNLADRGDIRAAYGPLYGVETFEAALKATERQIVGKVILLMEQSAENDPRSPRLHKSTTFPGKSFESGSKDSLN